MGCESMECETIKLNARRLYDEYVGPRAELYIEKYRTRETEKEREKERK